MISIRSRALSVLALILAVAVVGFAAESKKEVSAEKKIARKDVPAAVMSAFQKAYPKAEIRGTNQETEDSTTYFEIESRDGKVKRDILYMVDGSVKEIEESISKSELPAAIQDAIAKEYPKGSIRKGERTTRDNAVEYELIVQTGKDKMEVVLDESGKIVKTKKLATKEEEDEKVEGTK
jgi:hypothetical protein